MKANTRTHLAAFTLVELIVTITIIAILATVSSAAFLKFREKARMVTEVSAARNLITAYLAYPADHGGQIMAGYQSDLDATDLDGNPLPYPLNARYPWRLAPFAPRINGIMLFNGNESALNSKNSDYLVSVMPNLGLNAVLLGGHFGSGSPLPPSPRLIEAYGKFHLTHLSEVEAPERLIVFASARSGKGKPGYFEIRPPRLTTPVWTSKKFETEIPAHQHGFVDFRYNGSAVTACLAGNVQLLNEIQLRDMRRWSNQAARENDPNFTIHQVTN